MLFDVLRRALVGTRFARATAGTLRLKRLKIGARVTVTVAMDSAHPSAAVLGYREPPYTRPIRCVRGLLYHPGQGGD